MRKTHQYISNIQNLIQQVLETQMDNVDEAGAIVADTVMSKGFVLQGWWAGKDLPHS